ncbi:MAG: helix-turn-helix transcriptional regulator [Oscillibacter sp.]|nr:helix-turn-helix transcriptional regulator [Oscillibacter sp.]MEA4994182.1 helix-turn-helix transcriptional regulator [Oscillibacter sp.]
MKITYKRLWKLLIDREMMKKDLYAVVSPAIVAKLGRDENVTTEMLIRICTLLHCDLTDIMELIPDPKESCDK